MTVSPAEQIQILVDALVATGWRLWATSHNNTVGAQRVFSWMRSIERGHLVLEVSSLGERPAIDRVGELLSVESSHACTIRTVDGRELRWENAEFIRIPRNEADNREIFLLGELR